MSLFEELKRRNVFKVGFAYLVIAWLVAQVSDLVLGTFSMPEWVMQAVLVLLAVGFIVSLLLAWAYELTSHGIRKESEIEEAGPATAKAGHMLYWVIIGVLALAATYLFFTRQPSAPNRASDIEALIARPSVIVLPFANISGDAAQDTSLLE